MKDLFIEDFFDKLFGKLELGMGVGLGLEMLE